MLSLFTGLLVFILVLDCILLTLLVLIQLPKKESGLGTAFGSSATDALFGAGTGTALTKATKYAAGVFFALTILLAMLGNQQFKREGGGDRLKRAMEQAGKTQPPATTPAAQTPQITPTPTPPTPLSLTNLQVTNISPGASNVAPR